MTMQIWFHPRCSKARTARELLEASGLDFEVVDYLATPPSRAQLEALLRMLGSDDPRTILRPQEAPYADLGLADADRDALLEAIVRHPILLERPIVVRGDRALIARPPERVHELLA